jgi:hypothetical protein
VAGQEEIADRARDGIDHLQAAAKELIAAGRAMLDAAETLVDDPAMAAQIVGAMGTLAKLAGGVVGKAADLVDDGDDNEGSRVERIRVS